MFFSQSLEDIVNFSKQPRNKKPTKVFCRKKIKNNVPKDLYVFFLNIPIYLFIIIVHAILRKNYVQNIYNTP